MPNILFLFQDPKQDTTLDLLVMCPRHLWGMRVSHIFIVFDDDSFVGQVYLSGFFFPPREDWGFEFLGEEDHGCKMPFS